MMTLHLAKGEVSNADNKTIRVDGTGHDIVEYGYTIAACRKQHECGRASGSGREEGEGVAYETR